MIKSPHQPQEHQQFHRRIFPFLIRYHLTLPPKKYVVSPKIKLATNEINHTLIRFVELLLDRGESRLLRELSDSLIFLDVSGNTSYFRGPAF